MTPYFLLGGSVFCGYQLIFDVIRAHGRKRNSDRPMFLDHIFACTVIGAAWNGFERVMPKYWVVGAMLGMLIGPMTWVLKKSYWENKGGQANIYYDHTCTKEEVDRIRALDEMEILGNRMKTTDGFGYFTNDQRYI